MDRWISIRIRVLLLSVAFAAWNGFGASLEASVGSDDSAQNAFVRVRGGGVRRVNGLDFVATGGVVRVEANPGWQLLSPSVLKLGRGEPVRYRVRDYSGENTPGGNIDEERTVTTETHVSAPRVAAEIDCKGPWVYAAPQTQVDFAMAVFRGVVVTNGLHRHTVETYRNGELVSRESRLQRVDLDRWQWAWKLGPSQGAKWGESFSENLWNATAGVYTVTGAVEAVASDCEKCRATASARTKLIVSELTVSCDAYIGQDRTGDPTKPYKSPSVRAVAHLTPANPSVESVGWTYRGGCEQSRDSGMSLELWTTNREYASSRYLGELVRAKIKNLSVSTNFTVVKVDVAVGKTSEADEGNVGAFVPYVSNDKKSGRWPETGTNALVAVSGTCEPKNLPAKERISVTGPGGYLFERKNGGYVKIEDMVECPASEIGGRQFYLHGHEVSSEARDREVSAIHGTSGAVDKSKFTVVKVNLTATGLDGVVSDEKEETAGAFIHWNIDNDDDSDNTLGYPKHPGGDFLQTNETMAAENELQPLRLEILPKSAAGLMTLTSEGITLWRFLRKGRGARTLAAGETLTLDLTTREGLERLEIIEGSLYAEGVEKGAGSVEVKVGFGGQDISDKVAYRVVAANCGNQPRSDFLPNGEDMGLGGSPKKVLQSEFPELQDCEWSITGLQNLQYNCLAWSVGLTNVWVNKVLIDTSSGDPCKETWENRGDFVVRRISIDGYYGNNDGVMTMDELDRFFREVGNAAPVDSYSEADILYYDGYHAAKRLKCTCGEGRWMMFESKCGGLHRIEHVYDQLRSAYGEPVRMYKTNSH